MFDKARYGRLKGLVLGALCIATIAGANPILTPGVWKNISPNVNMGNFGFSDISLDPSNSQTIYVNGYRSTNGGETWNTVGDSSGPNTPDGTTATYIAAVCLRIDPNNPQHLYATRGVTADRAGFWVSTDGGAHWAIPAGFLATNTTRDVTMLDVDPMDFNHALVMSHSPWAGQNSSGVLETKDGGVTWIAHLPIAGWSGQINKGIHFLYDPVSHYGDATSRTWLVETNGQGIWRTTDAGSNWTKVSDLNAGHGMPQIYYAKNNVLYMGAELYPVRSTDNGASWTRLDNSGLPYSYYMGVIGDGTSLYITNSFPQAGAQYNTPMYTSQESDGLTWKAYDPLKTGSPQKFDNGPAKMAFDRAHRIVYSVNWAAGVWALKVVDSGAVRVSTSSLKTVASGAPYTDTLSVVYGKAPFAWSLVAGALPAGLALSQSGIISGTTTVDRGVYHFAVQVADADGATSPADLDLLVDTYRNPENPTDAQSGLSYEYFEGSWTNLPAFASLTPVKSGACSTFTLSVRNKDASYGIRFTGYIDIPADGSYTFYTTSDDGSRLFIGTDTIVDNDGSHGAQERSGTALLKAGKHAITVDYFQGAGGQELTVSWQGPGVVKAAIPAAHLFHGGATVTQGITQKGTNSPVARNLSFTAGRFAVEVPNGEGWTLNLYTLTGARTATFSGMGSKSISLRQNSGGFAVAKLQKPSGEIVERICR